MNDYPPRKLLKVGMLVEVAVKDEISRGYIVEIISQTPTKNGVKVRLSNEVTGKVVHIVTKEEIKQENFVFYNRLLYEKSLFSLYDNEEKKFWTHELKAVSCSFLFQDKNKAQAFLDRLPFKQLSVRAIPRNKPVSSIFSKAGATVLHIDLERKIHLTTLVAFEQRIGGK